MEGYVVRKGNQHYAVIYEGLDPLTGRERRRWHPAGPDRDAAEQLAAELAGDWTRHRFAATVEPDRGRLLTGGDALLTWMRQSASEVAGSVPHGDGRAAMTEPP